MHPQPARGGGGGSKVVQAQGVRGERQRLFTRVPEYLSAPPSTQIENGQPTAHAALTVANTLLTRRCASSTSRASSISLEL